MCTKYFIPKPLSFIKLNPCPSSSLLHPYPLLSDPRLIVNMAKFKSKHTLVENKIRTLFFLNQFLHQIFIKFKKQG